MMGVCFDCLVEIDGFGNRQACLTPIAEGMQVRRQSGARGVS
jgi:predicted molibdopterin-dependent oxidoreductase YjgC